MGVDHARCPLAQPQQVGAEHPARLRFRHQRRRAGRPGAGAEDVTGLHLKPGQLPGQLTCDLDVTGGDNAAVQQVLRQHQDRAVVRALPGWQPRRGRTRRYVAQLAQAYPLPAWRHAAGVDSGRESAHHLPLRISRGGPRIRLPTGQTVDGVRGDGHSRTRRQAVLPADLMIQRVE